MSFLLSKHDRFGPYGCLIFRRLHIFRHIGRGIVVIRELAFEHDEAVRARLVYSRFGGIDVQRSTVDWGEGLPLYLDVGEGGIRRTGDVIA